RRAMETDSHRAAELGLGEDELAFYDAIAAVHGQVADVPVLRDLVHDVVGAIKRNLKVDWTAPHREDVRAAIRAAVKRALRRRDLHSDVIDTIVDCVMA